MVLLGNFLSIHIEMTALQLNFMQRWGGWDIKVPVIPPILHEPQIRTNSLIIFIDFIILQLFANSKSLYIIISY